MTLDWSLSPPTELWPTALADVCRELTAWRDSRSRLTVRLGEVAPVPVSLDQVWQRLLYELLAQHQRAFSLDWSLAVSGSADLAGAGHAGPAAGVCAGLAGADSAGSAGGGSAGSAAGVCAGRAGADSAGSRRPLGSAQGPPSARGRVLVTGGSGLLGGHLLAHLADEGGWDLHSLSRTAPTRVGAASWHCLDLTRADEVESEVAALQPDWIVHLAAQSSVRRALEDPLPTLLTNLMGTLGVLRGAARIRARVLVASSAEVYGAVPEDQQPITEGCRPQPRSLYAVSKLGQELLARAFAADGLSVLVTRSFVHTGPGRDEVFAESSFARQIVAMERSQSEGVLRVGNLEVRRDLSDARDAARGLWAALTQGHSDVYNLCSGQVWTYTQVVDMLRAHSRVPIRVEVDPERLRPADTPLLWGSPARLAGDTGWQCRIALRDSLSDLLAYWRSQPD